MLIKRVYEIDPLACPRCGDQMKVVAFVWLPQRNEIEKILQHCSLWYAWTPRGPPAQDGSVHDPDDPSESPATSLRRAPGTDIRGHPHVLAPL